MKTFIISDPHFGQDTAYTKWVYKDGSKVRPWAENAKAGDKYIIHHWNKTVGEFDKVYLLGDIGRHRKDIETLTQLNGRKVLIKGNHDIHKLKDYLPHFKDIRAVHKLDNFILSHIPIHPRSLPRWAGGNIHGHLHGVPVMKRTWYGKLIPDPKYINVSVEMLNCIPKDFEEIKREVQKRR